MDEGNSIIYGLEHQARALSPQFGENEAIRFVIGTQSLTAGANRLHVVELEEDTGALHTKVFKHEIGEVWHLRCSPHDAAVLTTTHNIYDASTAQCLTGVSVLKLPTTQVIPKDIDDLTAIQGRHAEDLEVLHTFRPEKAEEEVRCSDWHPTDQSRLAVVSDSTLSVYDLETQARVANMAPKGRTHIKFTTGKWCPHRTHSQLAVLQDTHIRCYDIRSEAVAWGIDKAHGQLARDLDLNPNRQFQLASVGDDGALRIWDYRNTKEALMTRNDHSHWVWTVRYNTYHEQLLLTGSSDARALLTAASFDLESETEASPRERLADGVLQSYEQHEDSVYSCEWSSSEPWSFASLSYDGQLVLCSVPRQVQYKLLLRQ